MRVFGILNFATSADVFGSVSLGLRTFTPAATPDQTFNGTYARGSAVRARADQPADDGQP